MIHNLIWRDLFFLLLLSPLFLSVLHLRPAEASECQTVHCIVGNVVEVLHGCWAEDVHFCWHGLGTRRPFLGCLSRF